MTASVNSISITKNVTLDLDGHTITHKGVGTDPNHSVVLFDVMPSGGLTLKGGNITLDGNYTNTALNLLRLAL